MDLLKYISELSSIGTRQTASKDLAKFLSAEDLIILIKNTEKGPYHTASGFNASLLKVDAFLEFFLKNKSGLIHKGSLLYADTIVPKPTISIRTEDSSTVALLMGGNPSQENIIILQDIFPLLAGLLQEEQRSIAAENKADTITKLKEKNMSLIVDLEKAKAEIMYLLAENSSLIEKLKEKNHELNKTNTDLDNFIYTASHDLKAPVSNIEGLVHVLSELLDTDNLAEAGTIIKLINNSIIKFKGTIVDLTEISKIQRIREENLQEKVEVKPLIDEIKLVLAADISRAGANIICDIQINEIFFSKKHLRSVLYNLLSNGLKYQSPDRTAEVKINTFKDQGFIILQVQDNGLGIKQSCFSQMFTMFKRFHNHVEGTGVGLYIVKRIVENSGGRIEVSSEENIGTTFKVYLPDITLL